MAQSGTVRREKKQPNYTQEEKLKIIEVVARRERDLFAKAGYAGVKVEERKRRAWEDVASKVRACGGKERHWKDIKKKWQDLKTKALKLAADSKLTGGGAGKPVDYISTKVLEVLAPEVRDGLASSQNEAGLGENTSSQQEEEENKEEKEEEIEKQDEEVAGLGPMDEEILGTVTEVVTLPGNIELLLLSQLQKMSGQLDTVVGLLRQIANSKEE